VAFLKVLQGSCPGQILPLTGARMVLGRHPNCEIVVDHVAVSRHHAQVLESHGTYYLEDLRSRNGTYLNGVPVEGRTQLRENDAVKVCDVLFSFHLQMPPLERPSSERSTLAIDRKSADAGRKRSQAVVEENDAVGVGDELSEAGSGASSIISTLDAVSGSSFRLGVNPEAKLRAVLEISNTLSQVLKLDEVLHRTLDGLFKIFPQADEGFVLLKDPQLKKLIVKATKSRNADSDGTVRISMTIVKQAISTGEAILSADALSDGRFQLSESLSELQIRSMMCVPLVGQSEDVLGVMQIDTKDVSQQFSQADLDVLLSVASQVSLAVENAGLHEEVLKQRVIERDLEFATQVQLGFLPTERPKLAGYEFYDFYEAALRIGGDYFDYISLPENGLGIALGDVAGKGVPAALLMARLFSSARYHLLTRSSAAKALTGLNAELASSGLGHRFITCVLVIVDPHKHEITIANAGHLPPLRRDAEGNVESLALAESGMPLGISPTQEFNEVRIRIELGDLCVLYTDGITEAMNSRNEIYGRKRLCDYIANGPAGVDKLVKGIVADVEDFCGGRTQRDDMCLVGLRRCD